MDKIKRELKSVKGFTLIELMIVVAIVGILVAVAYPSYLDSVTKSRRVDAQGALLGLTNAMELYFTENNTYLGAAGTDGAPKDTGAPRIYSSTSPIDGSDVYYKLIIQAATATTYNLRATPEGSQANNGFLEMNNTESTGRWDENNNKAIDLPGEGSWN